MTKPHTVRASDWVRDLSMDVCILLSKNPTKSQNEFVEASTKYFHNLKCKHTFMRSVLVALTIQQIQKQHSSTAWIKAVHCHRRCSYEARVNNRPTETRPPANQSGVVQHSDQWLEVCRYGAGTRVLPNLWDKPLCFGRPVLISVHSTIWAWILTFA